MIIDSLPENIENYRTIETPKGYFSASEIDDTPESDSVNHPSHYETGAGFECIDVLLETQGTEAVKGFCLCNAMKYLYRHTRKNGVEDIRKAKWYLDKYLELVD